MSPDAKQIAFGSDGRGTMDLYVRSTAQPDDRRLLASLPDSPLRPSDWSADGRVITGTGLGALTWLFRTPAREAAPRLDRRPVLGAQLFDRDVFGARCQPRDATTLLACRGESPPPDRVRSRARQRPAARRVCP
jgi:hypothetical protein